MKLSQLVAALPSLDTRPQSDPDITLLTADSRKVVPGALFVAYPGVAVDGHNFIADAIERGAVAIIGERNLAAESAKGAELSEKNSAASAVNTPYLKVHDGREAFAWLNAAWYGFPARQLIMIGVTGTDGKTTTSNLIHSILTAAGIRAGLIGSVNAMIGDRVLDTGLHTTTPDADDVQRYLAEMVDAGITHCVLRPPRTAWRSIASPAASSTSPSSPTSRTSTSTCTARWKRIAPRRAVVHLAHRGQETRAAQSRHPQQRRLIQRLSARLDRTSANCGVDCPEIITYGIREPAHWNAIDIDYRAAAIHFNALHHVRSIEIATPLVGEYNVSNCLAAIAATVDGLGIDPQTARSGIATLKGIPGRMERIDEGQPFMAIVDFAHTPNALDQAIAAARIMTDGK
jgi:UDP-N-acetylmuramoyl-L-alanyl-D-glutamate--2,6-diaminopimelate ligase